MQYPDYDFASQFFNCQGLQMHYVDQGPRDAPPVVMVHGNPSWSFYFRHLIAALAGQYRVIAMDHIGMGLSEKPNDEHYPYTFERRADDLACLLEHLDITDEVTLVVHDWGGMIGMAYATRHLEAVKRLIVFNTGAFHLPEDKDLPWQIGVCRNKFFGPMLVRGFNGFVKGAIKNCVTRKPMSRDVKQAYLAPYDSWANRRAVLRFVQDIPLQAGDEGYERITQIEEKLYELTDRPTLLCWGMEDFVFDHHFLNRWIEIFRNAEVHRFEDAGHYVLEDAHQEIVPIVKQFLQVHPL